MTQKKLQRVGRSACWARRSHRPCVDNLNSPAAAVKMHVSVGQRIERKIAPLADALAGVKAVADLADKDVSGSYLLTAESLHSQTLRVRITSVSARALSFFVCHEITSPRELLRGQTDPPETERIAN
jgi:hypothetical protein